MTQQTSSATFYDWEGKCYNVVYCIENVGTTYQFWEESWSTHVPWACIYFVYAEDSNVDIIDQISPEQILEWETVLTDQFKDKDYV